MQILFIINSAYCEQLRRKFDNFDNQPIVKKRLLQETNYKQNNNGFYYYI